MTDPTRWLLAQVADTHRCVIGLVGLPGAGKSTLAARWADAVNMALGKDTAVALGMDGFHLTRTALAALPDPAAALARRGAPWTFDPHALAARLRALRTPGLAVPWPDFSHKAADPVPAAILVPPGVRLVVVEGLYLLHRGDGWNLGGLLDACIYLDTPLPLAMSRLSIRHQAVWGMTPAEAEARIAANDRLNAAFVLQTRARADWIAA